MHIAAALGADVALIWSGKPARRLRLRALDAVLLPLGALWLAFVVIWESLVVRSGAPFFFRIWGVPFIFAGLFICIGRFFLDAYFRGHTAYGVDERNAYIVRSGFAPSTVTYALRSTVPIELKSGAAGSGTLAFGPPPQQNAFAIWSVGSMREFVDIPDASDVYRLITGLAERSADSGTSQRR